MGWVWSQAVTVLGHFILPHPEQLGDWEVRNLSKVTSLEYGVRKTLSSVLSAFCVFYWKFQHSTLIIMSSKATFFCLYVGLPSFLDWKTWVLFCRICGSFSTTRRKQSRKYKQQQCQSLSLLIPESAFLTTCPCTGWVGLSPHRHFSSHPSML